MTGVETGCGHKGNRLEQRFMISAELSDIDGIWEYLTQQWSHVQDLK